MGSFGTSVLVPGFYVGLGPDPHKKPQISYLNDPNKV